MVLQMKPMLRNFVVEVDILDLKFGVTTAFDVAWEQYKCLTVIIGLH